MTRGRRDTKDESDRDDQEYAEQRPGAENDHGTAADRPKDGEEGLGVRHIPKATVSEPSKLDPYKPLIQEDRKSRYKQRHTAKRIHNQLVGECPKYDASYPLVQRYVRSLREARHQEGTPGEAARRRLVM